MKQLLSIIFFLSICLVSFSQATSGTRVTAPIVPNDSSDVYPTHDAAFGRDGYRSVASITQRNAIKDAYRKEGMQIYVAEDSTVYQLRKGVTNSNWFKVASIDTTYESGKIPSRYQMNYLANFRNVVKFYNDTIFNVPKQHTTWGNIAIGNGLNKSVHTSGSTGYFNFSAGLNALVSNTSGYRNIGIGIAALKVNTSGFNNTVIGASAGFANTSGSSNIFLGQSTAPRNTTGSSNLIVGTNSGSNGNFTNAVILGCFAATGVTNKGINQIGQIKIGFEAGFSDTLNNKLYIENSRSSTPLIGGDFSSDKVGINKLMTAWNQTLNVGGGIEATIHTTPTDTMETKAVVRTKQDKITLTTTGTSGAASFVNNVLNVPQYSGGTTPTWGGITGTLSAQTDLNTALNAREPGLGNPAGNGYFVASTAAGVRSWYNPANFMTRFSGFENPDTATSSKIIFGTGKTILHVQTRYDGIPGAIESSFQIGDDNTSGNLYYRSRNLLANWYPWKMVSDTSFVGNTVRNSATTITNYVDSKTATIPYTFTEVNATVSSMSSNLSKYGNVVNFNFKFYRSAEESNNIFVYLGQLPIGSRPTATIYGTLSCPAQVYESGQIEIDSDGLVSISCGKTDHYWFGNLTWIISNN